MRNKIFYILIGLLVGILFSTTFAVASQSIKLIVNGQEIKTLSSPKMIESKIYAPIREIAEALNCDVSWDYVNRAVIVNGKPIESQFNSQNQDTVSTSTTQPVEENKNILPKISYLSHNQTASYANWDYKIIRVDKQSTLPIGFNDTGIAQGKYVVAIVNVKNNASYERELGSRFFIAKDDKGRTFSMDSSASLGYHQAFETKNWHLDDIGSSFSATIPIVFDVPLDAKNLLLYPKEGVGKVSPILIIDEI